MPTLRPVARADLIVRLRRMGFEGPVPGTRHHTMFRGTSRVTVPNPHRGDIGVGLLAIILREAGVSRDEWFESE